MAKKDFGHDKSSAMARLLAAHNTSVTSLHKGEAVKGKITKLTSGEITVDVNAKSEAIVLEKDKKILHTLLSMLKVGDEVEVTILNPESETGQPVVSLRRYLGNYAWDKLAELQKSQEQVNVTITDITKAGFVVDTHFGITGFLPQSYISYAANQTLTPGTKIKVTLLDLNRKDNKVIFSQKPTISEEEFADLTKSLKPGQKINATVSNITSFGIFVGLQLGSQKGKSILLDGVVHISEISWDKVTDLSELFSPRQTIDVVVIGTDREARRVNLSIKRLTEDPFERIVEQFPIDKKVTATVTKVDDAGVHLSLIDNVEGLIRKEKIPPTTTYKEGQEVGVTVSEIDKRHHKIYLSPVLLEKPIGYR